MAMSAPAWQWPVRSAGAFPVSSRYGSRDLRIISGHGMRTHHRHGLSWLCGHFYAHHVCDDAAVQQAEPGRDQNTSRYKTLSITIPEDLDYTDVFADIFSRYTSECELVHVRTTNMGSLFRLTYHITMRERDSEKAMIDSLRCRNGNLEISVSAQETDHMEL